MIPFDTVAYYRLKGSTNRFLELLGPNGQWEQVDEDNYQRQFIVKAHKERPATAHYVLELGDDEVAGIAAGDGMMRYYIDL